MQIRPRDKKYTIGTTYEMENDIQTVRQMRCAVYKNKGRIERLDYLPKQGLVVKTCNTGHIDTIGPEHLSLNTNSSAIAAFDARSGRRVSWRAENVLPKYDDSNQSFYQIINEGIDENFAKRFWSVDINHCYASHKFGMITNSDFEKTYVGVSNVEDKTQLPYYTLVGFVNSFITQLNYEFPFECYIIIDTESGTFNIKDFKYIPFATEKDDLGKIYGNFIRRLSVLSEIVKETCRNYGRKYRIYAFVGIFTSVVHFKDLKYKTHGIKIPLNADGHFGVLIDNFASGGLSYLGSNELDFIMNENNISSDVSSSIVEELDAVITNKADLEDKIYGR